MGESKRIIVTGATGFIGSNLVRRLVDKKHKVHIFKRRGSDMWRIKDLASSLYIHELDLLDKATLSKKIKLLKPNIIFHLANLGLYEGNDPPLKDSLQINTLGTVNLIEATDPINYECFINTGSSSEYGMKTSPMSELNACEPITNYALSKLAGTLYALSYAQKTRKPLATLRIFSPYGPYDYHGRLITHTILKMIGGDKITVNNPYDVRDYIFIDDVIDAYLLSMKKPNKLSGQIFNIGSGEQTLIKDVIKILVNELGSTDNISWNDSIKNKGTTWQADISKARKHLGWKPKYTLTEGLRKTVGWFTKYSHIYA